ncbi:antiviral reverse transcriptase Drt2 [Gallaecimonas pentaromativorans]|uniref:antiviral reverse transcriptase Drt2 n=1 Tax=Gallaecimonas pentaromativorans TaxID=584787 RepID=UPI003A8F2BA5
MSHSKHPWYKPRGYLHFDNPIGLKKSERFATNPSYVAKHAFFPLISYNLNSVKIFKNSAGKIEKKCKSRPISYAAHMDSQIYSYYANILSEIYEEKLRSHDISDSVIAFRKLGNGKSNVDFANDAFEEIKRKKQCSVVALDISGFFDNLDHSILKIAWGEMLNESRIPNDHFNVYSSLTRYSSVEKEELYKALSISKKNPKKGRSRVCSAKEFRDVVRKSKLINTNKDTKGIPQGTPISALLSNIYMFKFDLKMTSIVKDIGGNYFRYCDDMLFIVPTDTRDVIEGIAIEETGIQIISATLMDERRELANC